MIGQNDTKQELLEFILNSNKSTALLCGDVGSGKKTVLKEVVKEYSGISYVVPDVKKETIKSVIEQMYKLNTPTIYIIPDIDNMSIAAMNSLLKIMEEPPNNAKVILTCADTGTILDTIYSRAIKYFMKPYTTNEIMEYCEQLGIKDKEDLDIIIQVCSTPGEVNILLTNGVQDFYQYVKLVFDNISVVSGTNALKIGNKIAFKEDSEGFDLGLFFILFEKFSLNAYIILENSIYREWVTITNEVKRDLNIKGINKSALFDLWVLKIREVTF